MWQSPLYFDASGLSTDSAVSMISMTRDSHFCCYTDINFEHETSLSSSCVCGEDVDFIGNTCVRSGAVLAKMAATAPLADVVIIVSPLPSLSFLMPPIEAGAGARDKKSRFLP